jgi:prepilin-type N-terminal cleavage/methylation domain-containing protein
MYFFSMLTNRLLRRTAPPSSQGGFTLVELLVVIGIIAILAGVALGPITGGIKKGQQSAGIQTARTIAISEFMYANDNNQSYPFSATDSTGIAKLLLLGGYINDPGIFYIAGSKETKYAGTTASTSILVTNISWDFVQISTTQGLNSNVPDQLPVVFSSFGTAHTFPTAAGADTITFTSSNPFGTAGCAVCYKSNSAKFVIGSNAVGTIGQTQICDPSFPGTTAVTAVGGG